MPERLMLDGFEPFVGKHCETTALKKALDYHKLSLSEEMLFGLGGGIGFIYWYMRTMPAPFVGGRHGKATDFLSNACQRIGADVTIMETSSPRKGYEELKASLRAGEPAVVYGDMVYLPYTATPEVAHFGGHAFVVFGLDEARDEVYIYDRSRDPVTVSMSELARARSSRFPLFPPKHKLLKISYPERIGNLEDGIRESIRECCQDMLAPSIRNTGLPGMEKWADVIMRWPVRFNKIGLLNALINGFTYIEIAGTGGSAFRPMYARFLEEASYITSIRALKEVAEMMNEAAGVWSEIASGFMPDSWTNLRQLRGLMVEKNRLFEEQEPGALETMLRINEQLHELAGKALADLASPPVFLADVQQDILRCHKMERKAIEKLATAVR